MPTKETINEQDVLLEKLRNEKSSANELQMRKHSNWNDNYALYRNRVRTNRLTQRQTTNIPLMKETIKTLLSKVDDAPNIEWKEMGGNEDKEILYQEVWDTAFRENKIEMADVIDKKNVLLYGISTKMFNITDTGVSIDILDPYDIVFDPLMSVGDIESARFIVRQNIFRRLEEILTDDRYTKKGKDDLKRWMHTDAGMVLSNENRLLWRERQRRWKEMRGIDSSGGRLQNSIKNTDEELFASGDIIVSLSEHFTQVWNTDKEEWERRVMVYANDNVLLSDDSLMEIMGVDFYPFQTWVEDPETTDIYSDSIADLVRTPNKVLNVWFSQLVENRTLKNFQMHWFMPGNNYTPQTYTPGPGAMLPAPPGDDINKVIKPVEVSGLDDTMPAIEALTNIVERATGATALEKGESEGGSQTLGEVEILVGKSVERTIGMAKFYRMAWYETAVKWNKIMHANKPKIIELYKVSGTGKVYSKKVYSSDWASKDGYDAIVTSTSEQEQNEIKAIQKWQFIIGQHPDNQALRKIALKRELDLLDLTPDEMTQITDEFDKPTPTPNSNLQQDTQTAQVPQDTGVVSDIQSSLAELTA